MGSAGALEYADNERLRSNIFDIAALSGPGRAIFTAKALSNMESRPRREKKARVDLGALDALEKAKSGVTKRAHQVQVCSCLLNAS